MGLKEEKESFVSGHTGSTPLEVLLVCISAPIGIFLYHEIRNFVNSKAVGNETFTIEMAAFVEAMTVLFPMALCQTKFLHPYGVTILGCEICLTVVLYLRRTQASFRNNHTGKVKIDDDDDGMAEIDSNPPTSTVEKKAATKLEFLTFYRSTVSYLTFVAILAVDFPIFPRSFAKTEVAGYGLMDLGAGSFCVSGGFVSWFARRKNYELAASEIHRFRNIMFRCMPLLIIGFIRLLTTKGLEYQEHVSEYGVHWNFFFTLSVVGIVSTFLRAVGRMADSFWWIVALIYYQVTLSERGAGFQQYIENAPRHCNLDGDNILSWFPALCHFFAANREGIWGCVGYLFLHLAGEDIAHYCLWQCRGSEDSRGQRMAVVTAMCWVLHGILVSLLGIPVSRRSTNASFIVWTIAHNMTILLYTWVAFSLGCSSQNDESKKAQKFVNPPIFSAVNRHGLIVFVLANLMTGAVNLLIDTLNASDATAVAVIFIYLCAIGGLALVLDYKPPKGKIK